MGCGDSKFSSDLDHKLKGTTLIGFVYSGGIILGAESRASNEREELLYPLRIRDDKDKMVQISSNIIYVVQGDEVDCGNMNDSMKQKFPYQGYTTPSVSCVVETMYNYQNSLDEKKVCGAIIAGWDASGPQVHRVFLKNKRVVKERAGFPAALGSGQIFALDVLEGYYYNMTSEAAIELAFKALFRATYFDKHSGGELKGVQTPSSPNIAPPLPGMNALNAYKNYSDLDDRYERRTLLLAVDAGNIEPVSANDLVEHFRPYAKLLVSHRVALFQLGDNHFYFHRLVFESEYDAAEAYGTTTPHGRTTPSYHEQFPNKVILDNKDPSAVTVYVNRSSRGVWKFLQEECQLI